MKTGLFCGTFTLFQCEKKLILRSKSNKETPKEITEVALRVLRTSRYNSLEFPYCFSTQISAFLSFSHPDLGPCSDSGGPSLLF